MSVDGTIENTTDLYCSPEDVARFVRPRNPDDVSDTPTEFTETTMPPRSDVLKHIQGASVRLERKTQQAWRANRVKRETHDHAGLYYWLSGHPLKLQKKNVRRLDPSKGDKLEVYEGNDWNDWLQGSYDYGRDADYWVDGPKGLLWVYERAILRPHPKFRVTYRYGYDMVPHDIREDVAKRAAADIVSGDFYGTIVPGNQQGENSDPTQIAKQWKEDFHKTCQAYKKVSFI